MSKQMREPKKTYIYVLHSLEDKSNHFPTSRSPMQEKAI